MAGVAVPLAATTITVTPATFATAFKALNGGDVLKLVGTFGTYRFSDRNFSKLVTLDATNAVFTSTLQFTDIDNLRLTGGRYTIAGAPDYTRAIAVYGGANITIDHVSALGSPGGFGVTVSGTNKFQVSSSNFSGLTGAVGVGSAAAGLITGNHISGSASDGIDIADSHGVTASYNSCVGGKPVPGAHPDCIQLWSIAGKPLQSDIVVRNNYASGPTQGFTSFSAGGGGLRLQIVGNVVQTTSFPQGIACYDCIDSTISNNGVSTQASSLYRTLINVVGGSGNRISGNVVAAYAPPPPVRLSAVSFASAAFGFGSASGLDATFDDDNRFVPTIAGSGAPFAAGDFAAASSIAAVPEPSSWAMLLSGFAAIGIARRRRRLVA